ncbi:MAG: hypothetical protein JW794_08955 [Candidatus Cloacimonetes bacterium]|nr:hypothetical protein [Candidatus Cloacimonadota bacterium]
MKIEKILVTIIILLLISSALWAQLEFYKEDLSFELDKNYFTVEGDYYFRNVGNHNIKATLFYPIPRDSILGVYDSAFVKGQPQQTESPITIIKENGFFFNVEVGKKDTACYRISYRQKLLGNKATYIFTTTNTWGKPLEEAAFRLTFPNKQLRIDSLSMIPDRLKKNEDSYTIYWSEKKFMPVQNLVILFHEEEEKDIPKIETKEKNSLLYIRITPLLIPGLAAGYVIRHNNAGYALIDFIFAANFHYSSGYHESYGFSFITEYFNGCQMKGIFYRLNLGLEYGDFFDLFEEGGPQEKKFLPNITGGIGYAFIDKSGSSVRLSLEVGWTSFLGRINIEYLF